MLVLFIFAEGGQAAGTTQNTPNTQSGQGS